MSNRMLSIGVGVAVLFFCVGPFAARALDLSSAKDMLGGGKKDSGSSTSFSDLAKGCEKGSQSQRAACYKDASDKAKTGADLCDKQAAGAKDSGSKKNFEACRDEGKRAASILQCIADGAAQGKKIDDLKKTCPATAGVKLG